MEPFKDFICLNEVIGFDAGLKVLATAEKDLQKIAKAVGSKDLVKSIKDFDIQTARALELIARDINTAADELNELRVGYAAEHDAEYN